MLKEISMKNTTITDSFWRSYIDTIHDVVIPYQYQVLNDELDIDVVAERNDDSLPVGKSHALENFRIAAGITQGEHFGWFFQDSDVYKWIESVAYSLMDQPNDEMEAITYEVIDLIGQTQEDDGYLNTFFQIKAPQLKYRQLYFSHELYCSGHLIEAAIAYDIATGKDQLLNIAIKNANHILKHFGPEDGKIHGACGHQEIELALVKLFEYTDNKDYLDLANYFIEIRGEDPDSYNNEISSNINEGLSSENPRVDLTYLQAYIQPKSQEEAKGHAVRMLYMLIGMAKIGQHNKDSSVIEACNRLWEDITHKKMYVTGAVGGTVHGEAFIGQYDLPNDTMYCETCASVALVNFALEMFKITQNAEYLSVLERGLYNTVLAGASVDGKHFFYVNPLEVNPTSIKNTPDKGHVKPTRPEWLGCACCPPNYARTVASLSRYIYLVDDKNVYVNLFVDSSYSDDDFSIKLTSNFPYSNQATFHYEGHHQFIYIRVPEWTENFTIKGADYVVNEYGFAVVNVSGQADFEVSFEQPTRSICTNPLVSQNINALAIQRGPFIFCAEEVDNTSLLHLFEINPMDSASRASIKLTNKILPETLTIELPAKKTSLWDTSASLYSHNMADNKEDTTITLIPYHLWGNRGENEMRVWLNTYA